MFNSLNGIITGKFSKKIYLQTQGIEWSIIVPESCLDEFPCVVVARIPLTFDPL